SCVGASQIGCHFWPSTGSFRVGSATCFRTPATRSPSFDPIPWFGGTMQASDCLSRRRRGRPAVPTEIRQLIREMSIANPLWGAPRIHGELLKLGIDIGQTSVAKYLVRRRDPPSQGWKTFLRNHANGIAAMDLFVVPTVSFRLLYGLLIMGHG